MGNPHVIEKMTGGSGGGSSKAGSKSKSGEKAKTKKEIAAEKREKKEAAKKKVADLEEEWQAIKKENDGYRHLIDHPMEAYEKGEDINSLIDKIQKNHEKQAKIEVKQEFAKYEGGIKKGKDVSQISNREELQREVGNASSGFYGIHTKKGDYVGFAGKIKSKDGDSYTVSQFVDYLLS